MHRREFFTALGVFGAGSYLTAQGPPGLLGGATVRADWLARHTEPISSLICPSSIHTTICGFAQAHATSPTSSLPT